MTLALLTVGLTVAGGVTQAVGAIQQGNAQAAVTETQARIDERNRAIRLQQTSADQDDKRRENRRNLASIRSAYGASGFSMAGSPLDVLEDTALEQELDVERIGYQGRLEAIGLTERAAASRAEGAAAKTASRIGAASALIGTATSAGKTLKDFR